MNSSATHTVTFAITNRAVRANAVYAARKQATTRDAQFKRIVCLISFPSLVHYILISLVFLALLLLCKCYFNRITSLRHIHSEKRLVCLSHRTVCTSRKRKFKQQLQLPLGPAAQLSRARSHAGADCLSKMLFNYLK